MTKKWNRHLGWLTVFVVAADWVSKFMVLNGIALYERVSIIDGWFYLMRTQNHGIAFGVMNNGPNVWRTSVLVLTAAFMIWVLTRLAASTADTASRIGIAFIAGGAVGNLGDRMINGGVTDFLSFNAFPFIFNLADAAIVGGAILLAIRFASQDAASRDHEVSG